MARGTGSRRTRRLAVVVALVAAVVAGVTPTAGADVVDCHLAGGVLRVSVEGPLNLVWAEDGDIMVGFPGSPDAAPCAALADVRRVVVTGTAGDDEFVIGADQDVAARLVALPFSVDLGSGEDGFGVASAQDRVHVRATHPDRLRVRIGADRAVVRLTDVEAVAVSGSPLDDRIVLRRLDAEGYLYGGAGDDHLVGTGSTDLMYGGLGDDRLVAGAGDDEVYGDSGPSIGGESGADVIRCGSGEDTTDDPPDPLDVLRGCEG